MTHSYNKDNIVVKLIKAFNHEKYGLKKVVDRNINYYENGDK